MNTHQLLQHCLLAVTLVGAAVCLATVLAYHFRNQLRELHERWLGLGPLGRVVSILAVTIAVLYGGTKSPTNDLTGATGAGATGVSPVAEEGTDGQDAHRPSVSDGQDAHRPSAFRPMMAMSPQQLTSDNQQLTTLPAWHRRGAYSDWQRIDFPDGFAFPHGTNLLTSVTLFAWGELRESFHQLTTNNRQLTTLPTAVSLEPAVSCVTYGLTPSNSFLIAWQNACVNRSPTNRIDASIELFPSGVCSVRFGASQTDYPPTPPPGFVGSGQDTNWLASVFTPTDYAQITNKGYEVWLSEDYVGVNEQNGHYKASITINQ